MPFCSSWRPLPAFAQHPSITAGDWLRVDFRARFQGDVRKSEAPIRGDEDGGLDIARRRVGIDGRVGHVDFQVEYELGAHEWRDVYLDYRQFKPVQVRAGIFKLPFGLDENTSATNLDFIYRSRISSRLAPGRDRGVSVHGRVLKNVVSYEAGVFGNDGDNARPSNSTRVFGKRTFAARVLTHPFRGSKSPLASLQIGAAISGTDVPLGFPAVRARTVFGASFYDSDVWVQGRRQRTGLEARWQPGPRVDSVRIHQIDRRAPRAKRRGRRSVAARGARLVRQRHVRVHPQAQPLRPHRGGSAVRDPELRQQGTMRENRRRARGQTRCSAISIVSRRSASTGT